MVTLVTTTKGDVDINNLVVNDRISIEGYTRVTATEWFLDGELVRRDVNVNILCGQSLTGEQEGI